MKAITINDNEAYLRQRSLEVTNLDIDKMDAWLNTLENYCKEHEVMAMAAVQLGIPKRIIYLKNTNIDLINRLQTDDVSEEEKQFNESRILINPEIIKREGLTQYWEACASCLDNVGKVKRPYKIYIKYFGIDGKLYEDIFEGFESTVLSHEMDHLDGILHMDIASEVLVLPKEERKKLRTKEGYEIISKDIDYSFGSTGIKK